LKVESRPLKIFFSFFQFSYFWSSKLGSRFGSGCYEYGSATPPKGSEIFYLSFVIFVLQEASSRDGPEDETLGGNEEVRKCLFDHLQADEASHLRHEEDFDLIPLSSGEQN
jgi:hypothetical protein